MSGAISRATEKAIPSAAKCGEIALGLFATAAAAFGSAVAAKEGLLEVSLLCGFISYGLLAAVISDIASQRTM